MCATTLNPSHSNQSLLSLKQQDMVLNRVLQYARLYWGTDSQDLMAIMGASPPDYCAPSEVNQSHLMPRSMQMVLLETLGLFTAIQNTQHPSSYDRAWLHQPTSTFKGAAPIDLVLERGLWGFREVRTYLRRKATVSCAKGQPTLTELLEGSAAECLETVEGPTALSTLNSKTWIT